MSELNDNGRLFELLLNTLQQMNEKLDKIAATPAPVEDKPAKKPRKRRKPRVVEPAEDLNEKESQIPVADNAPYQDGEIDADDYETNVVGEDDDDNDDFLQEQRLATRTSIRLGRKKNGFDPAEYNIGKPPEDEALEKAYNEGKIRKVRRRAPVKMVRIRCTRCGRKFQEPPGPHLRTEDYRCNNCIGK
jgi:DNA-directed RNA polymerase subunit RPC12/RpoP